MPPRSVFHPIQILFSALIALLALPALLALSACASTPPGTAAAVTSVPTASALALSSRTPAISNLNPSTRISDTQITIRATPQDQVAVSRTPVQSNVPAATLPIATQNARATIVAFPPICQSPEGSNLSPNGKWLAFNCLGENPGEDHIIKIASLDQKSNWELVYGKTIGTQDQGVYGIILPFHWSNDGHYLYLVYLSQGDGVWSFRDGDGLLRLDLFNGKVSEVLPRGWYAFSFSPNDKFLVYVYNHIDNPHLSPVIWILNITNGEKQKVALDPLYIEAGDFIWSSDEEQLVFAAAKGDLDHEQLSLILINLRILFPKILVYILPDGLDPEKIRPDGTIVLKNINAIGGNDLELINGKLIPIP